MIPINSLTPLPSPARVATTQSAEIEYDDPNWLLFDHTSRFILCDLEGKLVVLEKIGDDFREARFKTSSISVEEFLLKATERDTHPSNSIQAVLFHPDFASKQSVFILSLLNSSGFQTPKLFERSDEAILEVLEIARKNQNFDPLTIIDPVSGRNIFTQAAFWNRRRLLNTLIQQFPSAFQSVGQDVIAELLLQMSSETTDVYDQFIRAGGRLDTFLSLQLQTSEKTKPDENFRRNFQSLTDTQKRTIYEIAYTWNNPYVYEPSDSPVREDEYSINLLWINKRKIPEQQVFLFGEGATPEAQAQDFTEKFINPIFKWAKANPRSVINIWIDDSLATAGAIARSREALENSLKETTHGPIRFRNIDSVATVYSNREVFDATSMPLYFRVDLLKGALADHVLREKEVKYFIFADLDVEPLDREELFDKRTVHFLNDFGIVLAKGGSLGFENSFMILNGDHAQMMDSHRKVIVDLNVQMASQKPSAIREQQVYDTYQQMMFHFLDADGRFGRLQWESDVKNVSNSSLTAPLRRYRDDYFKNALPAHGWHFGTSFANKSVCLKKIMPRKAVIRPLSHFG